MLYLTHSNIQIADTYIDVIKVLQAGSLKTCQYKTKTPLTSLSFTQGIFNTVRNTVTNYTCPCQSATWCLQHSVNGTALNLPYFKALNATATFYDVHINGSHKNKVKFHTNKCPKVSEIWVLLKGYSQK